MSYSSSRYMSSSSGGGYDSSYSSRSGSSYSSSRSKYSDKRYASGQQQPTGKYSYGAYGKEKDTRNYSMLVRSPGTSESKAELMVFQGRAPTPPRYEKEKPNTAPKDTGAAMTYFTDTHFSSNFLDGNLSLSDMLKKK
eukprot:TRINITY_DN9550_c0_g1_i1.p1 TRINITY_DN9550_c0_g1~~TRINITY_DN9550_c0_g1_i1.p1  ORF type:complete len:147 (-),score=22.85 TRINITY_DN9550_c0_g1_i1:260-673(-)